MPILDPTACDDFRDLPPGRELPTPFQHGRLTYENLDPGQPLMVVDRMPAHQPDGAGELALGRAGVRIILPHVCTSVTVHVAKFTRQGIRVVALNRAGKVVARVGAPLTQKTEHRLVVRAAEIDTVEVTGGGGAGVLLKVCYTRETRREPVCDNFHDVPPSTILPAPFIHGQLLYESVDPSRPLRTVDWMPAGRPDGVSELHFSSPGVRITLPTPCVAVAARVAQFTSDPVRLVALDGGGNLLSSVTSPQAKRTEHLIQVQGRGITSVVLSDGGGEGVLLDFCYTPDSGEAVCDSFEDVRPGTPLPGPWRHGGLIYRPIAPAQQLRTVDWMPAGQPDGLSELQFDATGVHVTLPFPCTTVTAQVAQFAGEPVKLTALDAAGNMIASDLSPRMQRTVHQLRVRGKAIVAAVISGGDGEGLLLKLCYGRGVSG